MDWSTLYGPEQQPTPEAIDRYIGSKLWHEINAVLQTRYKVSPLLSYSKYSAQPGWNVKYKKVAKPCARSIRWRASSLHSLRSAIRSLKKWS